MNPQYGHIWPGSGRGPCIACGAENGSPGPCKPRWAAYPNNAIRNRLDRERGAPQGAGGLEHNKGAPRPGGDW